MKSDVNKVYTYLRGLFIGAGMHESVKALHFAREAHKGQFRKDGEPYISHPMSLAGYAVALGIREDKVLATILLHDVCEDCNIPVDMLPFSYPIVEGVKYMTIKKFASDTSKVETKKRYFNELLESREAIICKGIDRYFNLSDMPLALPDDNIGKNAAETELLLLPTLRRAKDKYQDLYDILFILRTNITHVNEILKLKYKEPYEKWYKIYSGETLVSDDSKGDNNAR